MESITLTDFKNTIDSKFINHIQKKTLFPYEECKTKNEILDPLYNRLIDGSYFVSTPRAFLIQGKSSRVARVIPVLTLDDYCIYYYCIKKLESELAFNRAPNTFGGFTLGGKIRKSENEDIDVLMFDDLSTPVRAFNKWGWVESWKEYQKRAWLNACESGAEDFLMFDIANFYDTVDINMLESKVRHAVDRDRVYVVNLLFSFLKNWNRKIYGYAHQSKGIPQDEVGDCSRILANFFLQDYDQEVSKYCEELNIKYLRYADDQMFMSNNGISNLKALYHSSILLHKIGLNINTGKVKEMTSEEFVKYWAFEIFDLLKDKSNRESVCLGIQKYFAWCSNKEDFRWQSVLSRIISCGIEDVPLDLRSLLFSECFSEEFLINGGCYKFITIYNWLDEVSKKDFIIFMITLVKNCRFNQYLHELKSFNSMVNILSEKDIKLIDEKIAELSL